MPAKSIALGVAVGLFALFILFESWYTIDQSDRGVILRNGAVTGVAQPGLGFKLPIIDSIVEVSIRDNARLYEKVETYSRDQQSADIALSVSYQVPEGDVEAVYSRYGSVDNMLSRLVDRKVYEETKTVFGRFNAVTAIQERSRLNQEVREAIQRSVQGAPIRITGVQIENIDFSDAYEKSIEQRMLAEVEVQKLRQNAEREKVQADIVVTQAQAKANAVRAAALADAEAIKLRGEAEASAIKARGDALRDNPGLVQLTQAERWDGKLPSTMIPGGATPMLNLGQDTR